MTAKSVKRNVKKFREEGIESFYRLRKPRGATVMTEDVMMEHYKIDLLNEYSLFAAHTIHPETDLTGVLKWESRKSELKEQVESMELTYALIGSQESQKTPT